MTRGDREGRTALGPGDVAGDFGQAVGKIEALAGIQDADGTGKPIVVGRTGKDNAFAAGDGSGLDEHIGPDALVSPEDEAVGAVGIDGPEALDPPQGFVGIFPAGVDDASVVEQGRCVVGLISLADDVDIASVCIASSEDVAVGVGHAAHVGVGTGGGEEILPSGR